LTIAALLPGASARAGAVTLDSLRSAIKKEYELYAPSDRALNVAGQQLNFALTQFMRYFGDVPPRIAVVIFDSPEQAKGFDFTPFRKRGIAALAWVLPRPGVTPAKGAGDPAAGAARSERPQSLGHQAAHLFFHILVDAKLAGVDATVRAEVRAAALRAAAGAVPGPDSATGHLGHPRIPDWLEESVGTLCELPAAQNARLDRMRANLDRRIPLPELFGMESPLAAPPRGAARASGRRPAKPATAPAADRATMFADESLALARYIADREGDRFMGDIAVRLLDGKTIGEALSAAQNLFSKPEALERGWVEWMKQPR